VPVVYLSLITGWSAGLAAEPVGGCETESEALPYFSLGGGLGLGPDSVGTGAGAGTGALCLSLGAGLSAGLAAEPVGG